MLAQANSLKSKADVSGPERDETTTRSVQEGFNTSALDAFPPAALASQVRTSAAHALIAVNIREAQQMLMGS